MAPRGRSNVLIYSDFANHSTHQQPLPDIVQTQGKHLVSRPTTPTYSRAPDPDFVEKLYTSLDSLLNTQKLRVHQYGENVAEEWPINHTPPEIKTNWAEEHTAVESWIDEFPATPSDDDGSIQLSTISGRTLTMHKLTPAPEHTLPKLTASKHDIGGCSNKISSTLQSTSLRRMSRLENTNSVQTTHSLIETIHIKSLSTGNFNKSQKRRLSDVENTPPVEPRRSKRRIAVPQFRTLIGVS